MPYFEKLKVIKEEKGLSNADIARVGNLPLPTVTRVFNGQTPNPSIETLIGVAIGMGISLDELVGLKQPDAPPIASPIEKTLNSYADLLGEKDNRIKELKDEVARERREKYKIGGVLFCLIILFVIATLALLGYDLLNGQVGNFRY